MPATPALLTDWLHWGQAAAYLAALAALAAGRARLAGAAAILGAAGGAAALGLVVWLTRRPPLLGPLESIGEIVFLLGLMALGQLRAGGGRAAGWCWVWCLALLGLLLCLPRGLNPDSFMFDYPWLLAFFQCRLAAIALLLLAAARHLAAPGAPNNGANATRLILLAGLCAFLAGEFAGAWWSFHWTGQFWRWNRGFLESAALMMAMVLPLHLPPRWAASPGLGTFCGVLPGVALASVTLIHQIVTS